jgi:hypothetical protein
VHAKLAEEKIHKKLHTANRLRITPRIMKMGRAT